MLVIYIIVSSAMNEQKKTEYLFDLMEIVLVMLDLFQLIMLLLKK